MTADFERFFVITGGPGSGKSTLLRALAERGFTTVPEAGRAIIQDQVAIGGTALPWANRSAFAELMLAWEMRSYREAMERSGPVFFDRGVPDVLGYLRLCNLPLTAHVEKAVQLSRYNRCVFIAPPWPEIFATDTERQQSFEEAVATYRVMQKTYAGLGYESVPLPLDTVANRVQFVLSALERYWRPKTV